MASKIAAEIARARKRPMDDTKMTEFLTKLRKDATGSLSFGKLVQVLDRLRWAIAPVTGWTPRHYEYKGEEQLVSESTTGRGLNKDALESLRERLAAEASNELPEAPSKVGEVVVMDVEPVTEGATYGTTTIFYFLRREWVGTEGVTVTSPDGQSATFLPDHHDLDRGHKVLTDDYGAAHDIWKGLKTMGITDSVNGALGTEAHVPAAQRTRENTGTCFACWGNVKLSGAHLVLHGYQRPGIGYIQGRCFGVERLPLESSDSGPRSYLEFLRRTLARLQTTLRAMESGEVNTVIGLGNRAYKRGDQGFEHQLERSITSAKSMIKEVEADLDLYQKIIDAWRPRPLPKEGELERGPRFFLK